MRIVTSTMPCFGCAQEHVTAGVLIWDGQELIQERKKEFGTTKKELERLRFWLMGCKVSVVAMESAGVYWKPVRHVLERQRQFSLKLVNAQHYHGVDGQKTDQIDAALLAELLPCGLLKGSFVPPQGALRVARSDAPARTAAARSEPDSESNREAAETR